jgi:hypothetical protein
MRRLSVAASCSDSHSNLLIGDQPIAHHLKDVEKGEYVEIWNFVRPA